MLLRLLLLDESVIEEALSVVRPLRKVVIGSANGSRSTGGRNGRTTMEIVVDCGSDSGSFGGSTRTNFIQSGQAWCQEIISATGQTAVAASASRKKESRIHQLTAAALASGDW
jgi:hypothetical protein